MEPQENKPRLQIVRTRLLLWFPSRGNVLFTLLVATTLLIANRAGALTLAAPAASTTTIPYQGRLADTGGNPLTGTYAMTFRLYAAASGGSALWTETWTGGTGVRVNGGLFNVMLGSYTPVPQNVVTGNNTLWLGITVGADAEMQPRVQLGSVPFAVQALTVPDGVITQIKAPSLLKTAATQAGGGQNWKFQSGHWCVSITGGALGIANVTFNEPFSTPPIVFTQTDTVADLGATIHVAVNNSPNVNATNIYVHSSQDQTICGNWIAFGT